MPNTLVHFGVQGLATQVAIRSIDIKWVLLGCLIPDIPWILQRLARVLVPGVDLYDLRLYVIVQASFTASVLLCAAFALISKRPRVVFPILVLNSLCHLILDASETKWGNSVHILAPFSWDSMNFGLVWPESLTIYLLTVVGLGYTIWALYRVPGHPIGFSPRSPYRVVLIAALFGTYYAAPLAFMHGPEEQDNHSVKTLRNIADRAGQIVYLDRSGYTKKSSENMVRTFAGEELRITAELPNSSGTVSIYGTFVTPQTIEVHNLHYHNSWIRDSASYVGLLLFAAIWIRSLYFHKREIHPT